MRDLSFSGKLELLKHNLTRSRRRRTRLYDNGDGLTIRVGQETIHIASPARWKKYRHGISRRILDVARQYHLLDLAPFFSGRVVVDVGANIGEFSLFAASNGAQVFSFEADEAAFAVLKRNIVGKNVEAMCEVLWKDEEEIDFHIATSDADSSVFQPKIYSSVSKRVARKLDDLVPQEVTSIFVMKADVEGAEPELLAGARETLKKTKIISLDCGAERLGENTVAECEEILRSAGFTTAETKSGSRTILMGLR